MDRRNGKIVKPEPARIVRAAWHNRLKAFVFSLLLACGVSACASHAAGDTAASGQDGAQHMAIHIVIGSTTMVATMEDNPTARDFVTQLPLTLTLRDFSAAEKVSGALPRRLSQEGAPPADAGALGDIAYYAPWGNIAFYRGQGPNASGVIKIAKITSGLAALEHPGELTVTISRTE